jgi:transposase
VVVLNPLQTRRYRDVLRKKAKTDDVDAYVIAGLLRSGEAEASYVPDEPMQSPRDLARQSTYSGKAAAARGNVVRTLVTQIERLTAALEELDAAIVAELPPPAADAGPSDAALLQTLPGIGPQTAATWLGELGTVSRFGSAKALVAYVGFYPRLAESGQRQEL